MTASNTELSAVQALEASLFGAEQSPAIDAQTLVLAMLASGAGISDLIFSPGRPPQVERHGQLAPVAVDGFDVLTSEHTSRVARAVVGGTAQALTALREQGACDVSYAISS